jgi:Glucose-6-phosphate dehydrogenase, NAD binding domain
MSNTDSRTLPADALVIFGVTAGLVHKMLFRALYAMARRGVLNAPVVGVAAPKWSPEQLRKQAMDSITQAGRKSAIGNGKDHTDRYPTTPCLENDDGTHWNWRTTHPDRRCLCDRDDLSELCEGY